jgi:hypothetical protein
MPEEREQKPTGTEQKTRRGRSQRSFPASSFEDALEAARAIHRLSSGRPIRRLTLFDQLGKAPESGPSRQLITNSAKYGLIKGSYQSEYLELTTDGAIASDDDAPPRDRVRAQAKLAIENISVFKSLYERFAGNKLPAKQVLVDAVKEDGLSEDLAEEAVDTFIVNLKFVGLLKTLSGAERIVTVDHLIDSLPTPDEDLKVINRASEPTTATSPKTASISVEPSSFDNICFYVTPIGEEGSEIRKHSDLFLGSLVEPAVDPFKLQVIRADRIDKPGMITRQIVADLSFHNPNVFYELAIRHTMRLPTVQIIRKQDLIPFDLGQVRTIQIDSSDIYSFVPKIESYRAEISNQVRRSLDDPDAVDNPLTTFYPNLRVQVGRGNEKAGE